MTMEWFAWWRVTDDGVVGMVESDDGVIGMGKSD